MGLQLWFHAHGIDESNVHKPYRPEVTRHWQFSNLALYDYHLQADIELVFRRWLNRWLFACDGKKEDPVGPHSCLLLQNRGASVHSLPAKIEPTQSTKVLSDTVLRLFRSKYKGGAIRQVGVFMENLSRSLFNSFSLR